MQKITIISIGKCKNKSLNDEIEKLKKRITRLSIVELKEIKEQTCELTKKKEEELILNSLKTTQNAFLLTENGESYTTKQFYEKINTQDEVTFIISGPYGPSDNLKKKIPKTISLSNMTFTHEQALYLLLEQIYRAECFSKNIPYTK